MSRLAKKPIILPQGVNVKKEGASWLFKGPRGELRKSFSEMVNISEQNGAFSISLRAGASKEGGAILGTAAALFKNAILGVSAGYEKKLEIEGIGFKAQLEGNDLILSLGFTHPVKIIAPGGIVFKIEKNIITVSGADKEMVGQVAAQIRKEKPPEPYKGKGIHYLGEIIRRKAGKKAVAAT